MIRIPILTLTGDFPIFFCDTQDEKLKVVLGDVQKEFEGGVWAEKLGAKFGCYGSFLPTYERAPSLLAQRTLVHGSCKPKKPPSDGVVESFKHMDVGLPTELNTEKPYNGLGSLPGDGSTALQLDSGFKGSGDSKIVALQINPRKVTFRIKMPSEANVKKKNTAIYSGLGLEHSNSSSPEDDQRSDSESDSSPDRSPLSMIQIIRSHELPGGFLLSPLPDLIYEQEKASSTSREVHRIILPVTSKLGTAQVFATKIGLEPGRNGVLLSDKKDKVKDRKEEKLNKQRGESEVDDGYSKKNKWDGSVKRSGKECCQSVSKHPFKIARVETQKRSEMVLETLGQHAVSEPGKRSTSRKKAQNLCLLASDRDKDAVSEAGKGMACYDRNKDHVKCSKKHKRSFSDCTRVGVKNESMDSGSPHVSLKDVLSSREVLKVDISSRGSIQENAKKQLNVSNQVREIEKEVAAVDIVEEGRKQMEVNRDLVNEGKKLSDIKEAKLLQKEKIMINTEAPKYNSKDKGQNSECDISTADKELRKDAMGETKKKLKDAIKDIYLSRESFKDGEKDSSIETFRDLKRDSNWNPALCKEAVNDSNRDAIKVKYSHKKFTKELTNKENMEARKKEKIKEGKVGGEGEREQPSLAKANVGNALDHLPSELQTEGNHADQKPLTGILSGGVQAYVASAPVVIWDFWVACDKCEKWRLLPPGIRPEHLPKTWQCEMLDWLQGMNNCRFTEEETSQALYTLLRIPQPPPQGQIDPAAGQLQSSAGVPAGTFGDTKKDAPILNKLSGKKMGKSEVSPMRSKSQNDIGQLAREPKMVIGDDNAGYAQVMEENHVLKQKGKFNHLYTNDDGGNGRSKKYMVQDEAQFQGLECQHKSDGDHHGKGFLGDKRVEKFLKQLSIKSRKSYFDVGRPDVQYQSPSIYGEGDINLMQKTSESDKIEPGASDAYIKVKKNKEGSVNYTEDFRKAKKFKAKNHRTVRGADHSSTNSKIETAEADIPCLQRQTGDREDRTALGMVGHGKKTSAISDVAQGHSSKSCKDIVVPKKSEKSKSHQMIEGTEGRCNSLGDKRKRWVGIEENKKQQDDQRERKRKEMKKKDARWLDQDPTSRSNDIEDKNIANEEESESDHRKQNRLKEKTYPFDKTETRVDKGRMAKPPLSLRKNPFEFKGFEVKTKLAYRKENKSREI